MFIYLASSTLNIQGYQQVPFKGSPTPTNRDLEECQFDEQISCFDSHCLGSIQYSSEEGQDWSINVGSSPHESIEVQHSKVVQFQADNEPLLQLESSNSQQGTQMTQISYKSLQNESHMSNIRRVQKLWGSDEDCRLRELHQEHNGRWKEIAKFMSGRNASQCSQRWRRINPIKQDRKHWTSEEDDLLVDLVARYGRQWILIAKRFKNVNGKQIRERFINKLDRRINKEPWTYEEDMILYKQYLRDGPKWAAISAQLQGRPENAVKNRFYSYIRRAYIGQENPYQVIHDQSQ